MIEWMEAAKDFLVINGLAGLIIISDGQVLFKGVSPKQFMRILGQGSAGPGKVPEDWHACYFEDTQKLQKVLDEHNLRGWGRYRLILWLTLSISCCEFTTTWIMNCGIL